MEQVRAAAGDRASTPLLAACERLARRLDASDAPEPWSPLTRREYEVARLVARGLTNREIAEALRISVRTAGAHLEHINTKLGMTRRAEVAAWATTLDRAEAPRP